MIRLAALMCAAHVLSMLGFAGFPALLPELQALWALSNREAGFVAGAFFAGYMLCVVTLSAATDRFDARRVYLGSSLLAGLGYAGFAWLADGTASGAFWQAVAGAGMAGTYMPGLKLLTDAYRGGIGQSRAIAFYTATFGIGASLSFLQTEAIAALAGWRAPFLVAALGAIAAGLLVWRAMPGSRPRPSAAAHAPFGARVRLVLADAGARRYMLGYAAHCWELLGLRAWIVAFLAFNASQQGSAAVLGTGALAALINLFGTPASVLGNELAERLGRDRFIAATMLASLAVALLLGASASLDWRLVLALAIVYMLTVVGDSAALTTGFMAAVPAEARGVASGLYSFFGFGAGFVAPYAAGLVLDAMAGRWPQLAWVAMFGMLAGFGALMATRFLAPLRSRAPA